MKMYQIEEVKPFMAQLLLQETFDKFCVSVAEIRTIVLELIKGKQTPDFLKIQFVYYSENGDCGGLRVQFEAGTLTCLSTYTPAEFSLDRNAETFWDENCQAFLKKHEIVSTQL